MLRVPPEEYERLDLRAHALLADVPLHDVWAVDLPGGGAGRTMLDVRALLSLENLAASNAAVRFFFRLRGGLGRIFGWDRKPRQAPRESFLARLSSADRQNSLVPPGSSDGPFRVLFVSARESIGEIHNATVHAFSVSALVERSAGYRFYMGIYVRPVGRVTGLYMGLIDPFRRILIYPAMLRQLRAAWVRDFSAREAGRGR